MLKFDIVNFVCVVVNLLVLYVLMKKFVFGRVTKIIDARQALLEEKKASVAKAQEEADRLKKEYQKSLENANETSVQIVKEAKSRARAEYNKIMARAAADGGYAADESPGANLCFLSQRPDVCVQLPL